jgi:hypothetical protein
MPRIAASIRAPTEQLELVGERHGWRLDRLSIGIMVKQGTARARRHDGQ